MATQDALIPNIQAGEMKRRIALQLPTGVTDADTDADTDAGIVWTTFANVWAAVEAQAGTVVGATAGDPRTLEGVTTYLVRMRYIAGVISGMQIYEADTGLTLDVLSVIDINEVHRQLHLQCVARRYPPV